MLMFLRAACFSCSLLEAVTSGKGCHDLALALNHAPLPHLLSEIKNITPLCELGSVVTNGHFAHVASGFKFPLGKRVQVCIYLFIYLFTYFF